ncbi:hemagglutinin [Photorhabdus luminescens]|nr:hemagglutinin [Photorhabdus luminescens]
MNKRNNSVARVTSYLLIYLTAIQPLHPAIAAGITPDNNHTQVQNQGNIPVINIATPNNAGISHNIYKEFNVATQGAVLNNATQAAKSQLAGQLNANPNLHGKAAELIINEVTGSGRSHLQGQLEIFGNKANVMIANPNGITCDGCGFINTSSATLTTGKPQFDKQGALAALEVKKGQITIGGKGLDGKTTDYVDIISRATELNGKIQANNLSLTQGANRISLKDGTVKPVAGEGTKPQLAIDTKALGGMYANKIRLVATEDGIGVNLKELTSNQRDITLNANGKIELGNINAKTDLNIVGKETHIAPNIKVQAGRDIILENTTLDNKGSVTAARDMRIFGDTVRNSGNKALLQANNNMWIQKDAQGDKSHLIENRSATIKTNKGDLVARSHKMLNIRDLYLLSNIKPEKNDFLDFSNIDDLSDKRNWFFIENYDSSLISSGGNLYINSDNLLNINSEIHGNNDVFLTGSHFISTKFINTENLYNDNGNTYPHFIVNSSHPVFNNPYYKYRNRQENDREIHVLDRNNADIKQQDWNLIRSNPSNEKKIDPFTDKTMLSSGRNLVIDFLGEVKITSNKELINENELNTPITPGWKEKTLNLLNAETDDIKVKNNLILNANGFTLKSSRLNAEKDINIISSDANFVELTDSKIISKSGDLSILSTYYKAPYESWGKLLFPDAINILSTVLKGHNVSLISKNSGIFAYKSTRFSIGPDIDDRSNIINSSGDLTFYSGTNLNLNFINYFTKNKNTNLTAARDIKINRSRTSIDSSESISINGGINLDIGDIKLIAGKDVILNSTQDSKLWGVPITANSISISTGKDLNVTNSALNATENILMNSGGDLNLSAAYGNVGAMMREGRISHITSVNAGNKLNLIANNNIKLEGSSLLSKGDMTLTSGGYTYLKSAVDTENTNSRSSITHKEARLDSGKNLTILTGEGLLFQATKLLAKGVIDIAAKGGYLYAQAQEDVTEYTTSSTKRKWYGKKKTSTTTHHSVTNKVTEFIADGDINLLSRDDSTYEASKIETNKNARLTSTHGKINFKAVKDSSFEQTISQSKGFFIKNRDSGHRAETWVLPSVHIGGKLTIEAANGISADIKTQKGQSLQAVLATLGNTSETAWLKQLSKRQDVNWNEVQDAYENWDHKSQHLNPVVSAVIAISVAVVTAGAGVTVAAANGAAGAASGAATTAGASAATATTVSTATYGAVSAGISSLASTAAVKLINNKGNLSKTLKDMGNSEIVKSTLTSMAIGGALAGFDNVMGWDKAANGAQIDPAKAALPKLSNGDWSKVAQRIAGQSIISSSLGTAINGGSFKDNFTTALLANIGSQINAEGAGLIGKNGQVLDLPGKAISHAAVSALAAEIGGGDAKGAAAGALAAELAAITLDKTFNDPMKIQAGGKIIGSIAGAIATNSAKGANSGANAGEIVILFNHLNSMNAYNLVRELQEANKQGTPTEAIWNKYNKLSAAQRAEMLSACAGNGGLCTLTYQAEMEGGTKTADAISGLRWMFNLSAEDAHRISQFVTTENQNDLGLLYNSLPTWEKGALIAKEAVESAGIGGAIGGKASVASIVGKHRGSAIPVPEPIVTSNGLTYKSNPKHTLGQQGNRPNAGIEPKGSVDLFSHSISSASKEKQRYSIDSEKNVHRFSYSNDGTWHWSGSTGDQKNPLDRQEIPNDVKKNFGLPGKWR